MTDDVTQAIVIKRGEHGRVVSTLTPQIKGSGVRFLQRWLCVKVFGKLWNHTTSVHPAVMGTRWSKIGTAENFAVFYI